MGNTHQDKTLYMYLHCNQVFCISIKQEILDIKEYRATYSMQVDPAEYASYEHNNGLETGYNNFVE